MRDRKKICRDKQRNRLIEKGSKERNRDTVSERQTQAQKRTDRKRIHRQIQLQRQVDRERERL